MPLLKFWIERQGGYYEDKPELVWVSGDKRFRSAREAIVEVRKRDRADLMYNPEQYRTRLSDLLSRATDEEQIARISVLSKEFEQEYDKFFGKENPHKV